jgi:hypothetical protein
MDSRLLTYKTWKPMPESTNLFTRLLSQLVIGFLDGKNLKHKLQRNIINLKNELSVDYLKIGASPKQE